MKVWQPIYAAIAWLLGLWEDFNNWLNEPMADEGKDPRCICSLQISPIANPLDGTLSLPYIGRSPGQPPCPYHTAISFVRSGKVNGIFRGRPVWAMKQAAQADLETIEEIYEDRLLRKAFVSTLTELLETYSNDDPYNPRDGPTAT